MDSTSEPKYLINIQGPTYGFTIGESNQVTSHFSEVSPHPTPLSPKQVWNIPYQHNPFFTGRADLLSRLHKQLQTEQSSALSQPLAISGLGGIGKTQIALQYAYQHSDDYQTMLWVHAQSHEALTSSFLEIATLLDLPQQEAQDQILTVKTVKHWLQTHDGWLLILDSADEPAIVHEFLPTKWAGHILLTTRAQALGGLAQRIEVETFTPELGALFVLRRATLIAPDAGLEQATPHDREISLQISTMLGGLPLALDQAGAYIEETGCHVASYLERYQIQHAKLLKRRGHRTNEYPNSVATTWSLSFQQVKQQSAAAADLLQLCAFLASDAIPEEIILKGASYLGKHLQGVLEDEGLLDETIGVLRAYSLIRRDPTKKTLSIHQLVQAVLRNALKPTQQCTWVERVVHVLNHAIPEPSLQFWQEWQRYLPHIHACTQFIDAYGLTSLSSGQLLHRAGTMFRHSSRYAEAEKIYERALAIHEQTLGPEHPETAATLDHLATISGIQRKFEQAMHQYERALRIREQVLGPEHPETATTMNGIALLYSNWKRYEESQCLYERALRIREQVLGPEHPETAATLDNLAMLYRIWGKYEQAEPLFERALRIRERSFGPEHPVTSSTLNNLAVLYRLQGKYEQAIPLFERALHIREQTLGLEHPAAATAISNLAYVYRLQGKYEQSLYLYKQALHIREQAFGANNPNATITCFNMGQLYRELSAYERAEELIRHALTTHEQALGTEHPKVADILEEYARLQHDLGQDEEAKRTEARAQEIRCRVIYSRVTTIGSESNTEIKGPWA